MAVHRRKRRDNPPGPPPPQKTKVTIPEETRNLQQAKSCRAILWYTKFWVPDPPPPSNTSPGGGGGGALDGDNSKKQTD